MFQKHQVNRHIKLLPAGKAPHDLAREKYLVKNLIANSIRETSPAEILPWQMFL